MGKRSKKRPPIAMAPAVTPASITRFELYSFTLAAAMGLFMWLLAPTPTWRVIGWIALAIFLVFPIWHFEAKWVTPARRKAGFFIVAFSVAAVAWYSWPPMIQIFPEGGFDIYADGAAHTVDVTIMNRTGDPLYGVVVEVSTEPPSVFPEQLVIDADSDPNANRLALGGIVQQDVMMLVAGKPRGGVQAVFSQILPNQPRHLFVTGKMNVPTRGFARMVSSHTSR